EEKLYFARRFFGDRLDFKKLKHEEVNVSAIPRTVDHLTTTRNRSTSTDENERVVTTVGETDSLGQHIEYDYAENRTPYFYTPDELERLEGTRFSIRESGEAQRYGIARVNERSPTEIEIPALPPPMYSREEMAEWLSTFKATQPFTLPLIEARARFDALVERN